MLLSDYIELLKDPRWKTKRNEILIRDNYTCQHCWAKGCTLHVHHITRGPLGHNAAPWECTNDCLVTLCVPCHKDETFYGNDAQRYLKKVIVQKKVNPETIRNLTDAVIDIFHVKPGSANFALGSRQVDRPKELHLNGNHNEEEFSAYDVTDALVDLVNVIGRRFCAHPFMNGLASVLEKLEFKPGTTLEFWFELEQPEKGLL